MNNCITLIGRIGAKPVERQFENAKLVKFSIAIKDFRKDAKPMWIDVEAWNAVGDKVKPFVDKGREISVVGRLAKSKPYTNKDGVLVTEPVLKLMSFYLCGKKADVDSDTGDGTESQTDASSDAEADADDAADIRADADDDAEADAA